MSSWTAWPLILIGSCSVLFVYNQYTATPVLSYNSLTAHDDSISLVRAARATLETLAASLITELVARSACLLPAMSSRAEACDPTALRPARARCPPLGLARCCTLFSLPRLRLGVGLCPRDLSCECQHSFPIPFRSFVRVSSFRSFEFSIFSNFRGFDFRAFRVLDSWSCARAASVPPDLGLTR